MNKKNFFITLFIYFITFYFSLESFNYNDLVSLTQTFFENNEIKIKNYTLFNPDDILSPEQKNKIMEMIKTQYNRLSLSIFIFIINSLDNKENIDNYCSSLLLNIDQYLQRKNKKYMVSIFSKEDKKYYLKAHRDLFNRYSQNDCNSIVKGEEGDDGLISNFTEGEYINYFTNFFKRIEFQYDNNEAEYDDDEERYYTQDDDLDNIFEEDIDEKKRENEINNEKNRDNQEKNDYMHKKEKNNFGKIIVISMVILIILYFIYYILKRRKKVLLLKNKEKYFYFDTEMNDNEYKFI